MTNLDHPKTFQVLDSTGLAKQIGDLADQCEDAWQQMKKFPLPAVLAQVEKIVMLGMGASGIGGSLTKDLCRFTENRLIVEYVRQYQIPTWADSKTLVIAVSYSGDTDEVISGFLQAVRVGAKIVALTSGGKLASLCRKYNVPYYPITYGSLPRAAVGYLTMPIIGILAKIGVLPIDEAAVEESLVLLRSLNKKNLPNTPTQQNQAKQLAEKIYGKIPVILTSDNLAGVGWRWKSSFNENAKTLAATEIFPEIVHNAILGFSYPEKLANKIFVISLQSVWQHPKSNLKQNLTIQRLQQLRIPYETILLRPAGSPLGEMLQLVCLGDWASYYLAILNNVDPSEEKIIEEIKQRILGG